jgi:hypothetical protein
MKITVEKVSAVIAVVFLTLALVACCVFAFLVIYDSFAGKNLRVLVAYAGTVYGWEALKHLGVFFRFLLFILLWVFYQIICKISKETLNEFSGLHKKAKKAGLLVLLVVVVIISIAEARAGIKRFELKSTATEKVNSHLFELFGAEDFNEMKILSVEIERGDIFNENKPPNIDFSISTPLLNGKFAVMVNAKGEIMNSFSHSFLRENQIKEILEQRFISSLPSLPHNIKIDMYVDILNFYEVYNSNYSNEDLLNMLNAQYTCNYFIIDMEQYNQKEAIEIIKDLYITYYDLLKRTHTVFLRFQIQSKINYNITGNFSRNKDGQLVISFNAHIDDGNFIEAFKENFDI